jgi:hypothetical protein
VRPRATPQVPLHLKILCTLPASAGPILVGFVSPALTGSPGGTLIFEGDLENLLGYDTYLISWTITPAGFADMGIDRA